MKNDKKNAELAGLYLAFSGKIYASAHYNSFEFAPTDYRHVMEYAINNMSNKYDIVKEGSVIGAVRSLTDTYMDSYRSRFKDFDDDDVSYLLQQLKNRVKAFIINIAKEYYTAYENKDYITYDSDNLSEKDVDSLLKLNIPLFDCTLWYKGTSSFWVNGNIENIIDFKLGYNSKKEKIKISSPNFICGLAASLTIIHIINVIIQHQKILSIKYNFYQNNIEIEKKE